MNTPYRDLKNISAILNEFGDQLSQDQMATLVGFMTEKLEEIDDNCASNKPIKKRKEKYYTPTAIEKIYGIPKSVVGTIANKYKLKKEEYGIQGECTDERGNVWPGFRYNEVGKDKILQFYQRDYTN